MSIEIIGKFPSRERTITGLYSLDHAFVNDEGELGFPVGHGNEFFGLNYIGKSTFALGLSGILAKAQNESISFADLEGFDRNHLVRIMDAVGYNGKVYIPTGNIKVSAKELSNLEPAEFLDDETVEKPKKKEEKEYDELLLDEMLIDLKRNNCCVGILDSIGAISPISETEGDIGEANMGRRGLVMAQFSRKALKLCRSSKTPKTILMLNHWYPKLGGRGYSTPGGEVKRYLTSVQILLKQLETFPDESYILEGTVKKNRWGYPNKRFYIFMLAGKGIHLGLSWMFDGIKLGVVTRTSAGIKIKGQLIGKLKGIIMKAHAGEDDFFQPFHDAIYNEELVLPEIEETGEEKEIENGDV